MFLRRRCPNTLSLFLISGGVLMIMFMLKHLYDINQKRYRLENYKQYIQELTEYMQTVEISANKSASNLHRLNNALQQQQSLLLEMEIKSESGR